MKKNKKLMVPEVINYSDFFASVNSIEIPPYQRPYTWKEKNVKEFWSDILNCIVFDRKNHLYEVNPKHDEHYLGTLYIKKSTGLDSQVELIDGQQRVTTTFLIFRALKSKLNSILREGGSVIEIDEQNKLNNVFRKYLSDQTNSYSKLSLGLVDHEFLEQILDYEDALEKRDQETNDIPDRDADGETDEDEDNYEYSAKEPRY